MAGKKEAKQKAGPSGQKKRTEKKQKVPQGQRTSQKMPGEDQPKRRREEKRIKI